MKSGGLQSEKDYPYAGRENTCKFDKSKIVAQVKNFSVISVNEDQIAANLVKHGPLASKGFKHLQKFEQIAVIRLSIADVFVFCSCNQCGLHADIHRRRVVPLHLWEAPWPWCPPCWLRIGGIRTDPLQGEAVLDHQELVGRELGGEGVLQDLQGTSWQEQVRCWFHGLLSDCHPYLQKGVG